MKLSLFVAVSALTLSSGAVMAEGDDAYRAALRSGCTEQGTLHTTCGHRLDATVMQGLVHIKWDGSGVQPMLAENWTTDNNGKTWTFNLRDGVKWHDGEAFSADDVVFSLNLYANPETGSPWAGKLDGVTGYDAFRDGFADALAGVTKVDDSKVIVELTSEQPAWVNLNLIAISVFPEHILGAVAPADINGNAFWTNRVGTGPFIWNDYASDQFIEVVKNPDYFMGEPKLDRIVYQIYADVPAIVNALVLGEVDSMSYEGGGVPVSEVPRLQALDHLVVYPQFNAGLPTYLHFNISDPRFADARVRRAMVKAIDREAIVDAVMQGGPQISNTMFPQSWAVPDDLANDNAYDPAAAKALLAEAGWDSSEKIDFIHYYSDQVSMDALVAMQSMLAEVGVNIELRLLDGASINQVYADGTFEMGYFAHGQGLDPSLGADLAICGSEPLAMGYCNPEVDAAFAAGVASSDFAVRQESYHTAARLLNEDMPKGWLWNAVRPLAFNKRVVGLAEHYGEQPVVLFNHAVYNEIETWYIQE